MLMVTSKPASFRASRHFVVDLTSGSPLPISISACYQLTFIHRITNQVEDIGKYVFFCTFFIIPLFFGVLYYWDQKHQSCTIHMQQKVGQASTLSKSLCSIHAIHNSISEKRKDFRQFKLKTEFFVNSQFIHALHAVRHGHIETLVQNTCQFDR